LLWGSEAKAFGGAVGGKTRQRAALHHYLTLQYVPDPLTIFEACTGPCGTQACHRAGGEPQVSRWWQLEFEPKWKIDDRKPSNTRKNYYQRQSNED
jgi:asparagine synthase (glutamine-hydrolysing)